MRVEVKRSEERALLRVSDDGRGIEPELLPLLFLPFRQGGSRRSRESGLGLGLAITKSLVELHEGTVTAESAGAGTGSRFTIDLPLHRFDRPLHDGPSAPTAGALHALRLLVVDDESDTRELTAHTLRAAGAEVVCSVDAAGALARLEAERFDVIISDLSMPGTNGFVLAREIRARSSGSVALLALSSVPSEEVRARALEAGFRTILLKPVDGATLQRAVLQVVGEPSRSPS